MCIYCGTTKYRKIFQAHYGDIPKDDTGRSFDIHHRDGNRSNNDPSNLIAVSIEDHYAIHHSHGDWMACHRLASRMKLSHDELSALATRGAKHGNQNYFHVHRFFGAKNHKFDPTVYCWEKVGTKETVRLTRSSFIELTNASPSSVSMLINGTRSDLLTVNGYRLIKDQRDNRPYRNQKGANHHRIDHKIYQWIHTLTAESVLMTRAEFIETYSVSGQGVYNLLTGRQKTCKGWTVIRS